MLIVNIILIECNVNKLLVFQSGKWQLLLTHFSGLLRLGFVHMFGFVTIIKRVSWFKSSLLLRIQSDSFTNINS